MTTNAYAAKRAIIDRLKSAAELAGTPLNKWDTVVQYAFNGATAGAVTLYGGGVTFEQPGENDAVDTNRRRLVEETATVGLHIRITKNPPGEDGIRDTDVIAEEIGDYLGDLFTREPELAGGASVTAIRGGQGDYSPTEAAAVSVLSYRVETISNITLPST